MSEEKAQEEFVHGVLSRLVGATIVSFTANEEGDFVVGTAKDGVMSEFLFGIDPKHPNEVTLYEVEHPK
jgi:hypothetical protein